jgi:hypothetical protein
MVEDHLTREPRWVIYASAGKHASYASEAACRGHSALVCKGEDCPSRSRTDRELLFPVFNVGEGSGGPLATEAASLAWSGGSYCGFRLSGIRERLPCAPPVAEKLRRDPFAGHRDLSSR